MALLQVDGLTFGYDGSYDWVFENLTFQVDTAWQLGLTGRNGRGKTTLLRLLQGRLAYRGHIDMPCPARHFPFAVENAAEPTLALMRRMSGGALDWRLQRECGLLALTDDALERPYGTLSRGEQTKAQLAALFAGDDGYLLIDEPTNHLDLRGRALVGDYLRQKPGFLLVSHDRDFLNRCVDHVLCLNKSGADVFRGDYDTYERELNARNEYEQKQNERLQKDIRRLGEAARRTAGWSNALEKQKFHVPESVSAAADRGYIGAKSAKMMARAKAIQKRRDKAIEEKGELLHDIERVGELKLRPLEHPKKRLVTVENASVRYGERVVLPQVRFTVEQGERVALLGPNGAGKSSILKALTGEGDALRGELRLASGLIISYVPQDPSFLRGNVREFIARHGLDETLFKAILRNMDMGRQQFDKDMADFSEGQKKKVLLARSLCESAHLYVWDEALNYLDVYSRVQLEGLLLECKPTLLMVEHDRRFLERVCTRMVEL